MKTLKFNYYCLVIKYKNKIIVLLTYNFKITVSTILTSAASKHK